MKRLLSALFPYPWCLSLVCTWLMITALYVLAFFASFISQIFQVYLFFSTWVIGALLWITFPFVPIDFWAVGLWFDGFGRFLRGSLSIEEYVYWSAPLLAVILIFSGDLAMRKIGIPQTYVKFLCNIAFLLVLNVTLHMVLWQTWKPWIIFTPPTIKL